MMKKRLFSIFCALVLCLALLPGMAMPASAAGHADHSSWTALTADKLSEELNHNLSTGSYYLSGDVTASGVITINGEVTLCLNGRVLNLNGYYISVSGSLTLCDCNSTNQTHRFTVGEGGLWKLNETDGTETITGGVITGGNRNSSGGGVYVSGTFTMESGSIVGNTATNYGGGVYVSRGTFNMESGSIVGNTAGYWGGGVYMSSIGGTFTMSGGSISENTATDGGGVYVSGGTFTMESGSISKNTATDGGGVLVYGGTFNMESGSISENTASSGGGVFVSWGSTFNMYGGASISGNTANGNGGGVYVNDSVFDMYGGSISKNTASSGGGVYVYRNGTFIMSGGSIADNTATNGGGGVFLSNDGNYSPVLKLSGAPVIEGDIRLDSKPIEITGPLTGSTPFLVTNVTNRTFTSGWDTYMPEAIPAEFFTVSEIGYSFELDGYGEVYARYPGIFTVTLNTDGGTISSGGVTSYTYDVGAVLPTDVERSGYRFDGWYANADFSGEPVTEITAADYGDKEFWAKWTVISSGGGTPAKTPSQQAADRIERAKDGATVEITLKTGQTKLDKEVFEALAGRDVTLEINLPGGVAWTVNGQDIPADANLTDLDMGVSMNTSTIPVDIINAFTGEISTVQLSLAHEGAFGFTLTLSAPLGREHADLWANLYHYDAGALKFQTAARIGADGMASLKFTHASAYAIVIDDHSHALPFTDAAADAWYYDAVDYVYQNGLMTGTSATTFAPDGTMTRAMLVTILHRQAGAPQVNYALPFDDVAEGAWYSEAVRWAASEGIVTGTSATAFEPNAPITREQFAAILYRYAQKTGADVSAGEDTNILSYADALDVSEYAVPAMQWACGAGVIQGSGANLNPKDGATRAEAAAMLMRFCEGAHNA